METRGDCEVHPKKLISGCIAQLNMGWQVLTLRNIQTFHTCSGSFPIKILESSPIGRKRVLMPLGRGWGRSMSWRRARMVILLVIRPRVKMPPYENRRGEVREWTNRHAWKACVPAMGPWVRIPPSPPHPGKAHVRSSKAKFSVVRTSYFPLCTFDFERRGWALCN